MKSKTASSATNRVQKSSSSSSLTSNLKRTNFNHIDYKSIKKWSIETTLGWLTSIGYEDCDKYFLEHKINGRALLMLNEDDLKEVIKHNVGQRKNLYHIIKQIQINYNKTRSSNSFFEDDTDDGHSQSDNELNYQYIEEDKSYNEDDTSINKNKENITNISTSSLINNRSDSNIGIGLGLKNKQINKSNFNLNKNNADNSDEVQPNLCENCLKVYHQPAYTDTDNMYETSPIRNYRGEKRKTFLSVVYLFLTCLWTSFMLTVVHDRVPDMEKYPPLPDIILDNVPLIPWAFFATELIGLVLVLIFLVLIIFHKYRLIIFRRMCSLGGTIFFLRSITMLITSLSVPGIHIQCSSQRYGSLINKLYGAWNILSGGGLYVQGVRTCGDYMFSGHTVWLTLLTHFITEYTPRSMSWLHTFSWIMNMFGLFFILGAHEHYSIDVFVAFYITSRLFLYYHSLANNKVLFQSDHRRVKIWFPLFSYFESNIRSIVPNEYQYPPNIFIYVYKLARHRIKRIYYSNSSTNINNPSLKNKKVK